MADTIRVRLHTGAGKSFIVFETRDRVKHTPGPWKYDRNGDGRILSSVPPMCIALITGGLDDGIELGPTSEANARPIAAAPELLVALLEVVTNGEWQGGTDWRISADVYEMVRDAIAKASGP